MKNKPETINEHDVTVNMLNIIREGNLPKYGKSLLTEDDANSESVQVDSNDMKEEQKKFSEIVTPRVEFKSFNVYPDDNNVVLSGKLDMGIDFQFSKRDGLYINADSLKLDNETVETLKKMSAYYQNWLDDWSLKLQSEYKKNQ